MNSVTIFIIVLNLSYLSWNPVAPHISDRKTFIEENLQNDEPHHESTGNVASTTLTEATPVELTGKTTKYVEGSSVTNKDVDIVITETPTTAINDFNVLQPSTKEINSFEEHKTERSTTEDNSFDEFHHFFEEKTEASTTESSTEMHYFDVSTTENTIGVNEQNKTVYVNKLSNQIKDVLAKYKESGDVIISDVPLPDPLPLPDMDKRLTIGNINFKDQLAYGLSNFTVQHINTDLEKMQVYVMLHMKKLVILGNYSLRSLFNSAKGPFNVTLLDVTTEGAAALHYDPDGNLEASETDMDMSFRDTRLDFKNLGVMGGFLQGMLSAVGSFIFEGVKPVILTEVNTNLRKDINDKLKTLSSFSQIKPNSTMSPVDQAVFEGRRYIKDQGYDPYVLSNYTKHLGIFQLNVTEFTIKGLSRFYRVGDVSLSMDNGTIEFGVHLATDKLLGSCQWSVGVGNTTLRKGINAFSVEHLQVRAIICQSLDLTKHPTLQDLDFLLGNITLKTQREDTVDFMVELVVNNLPSIFRHIIVDGLEDPIKERAQKILDEVDVETLVDEQLPKLDNLGV